MLAITLTRTTGVALFVNPESIDHFFEVTGEGTQVYTQSGAMFRVTESAHDIENRLYENEYQRKLSEKQ